MSLHVRPVGLSEAWEEGFGISALEMATSCLQLEEVGKCYCLLDFAVFGLFSEFVYKICVFVDK